MPQVQTQNYSITTTHITATFRKNLHSADIAINQIDLLEYNVRSAEKLQIHSTRQSVEQKHPQIQFKISTYTQTHTRYKIF